MIWVNHCISLIQSFSKYTQKQQCRCFSASCFYLFRGLVNKNLFGFADYCDSVNQESCRIFLDVWLRSFNSNHNNWTSPSRCHKVNSSLIFRSSCQLDRLAKSPDVARGQWNTQFGMKYFWGVKEWINVSQPHHIIYIRNHPMVVIKTQLACG